MNLESAKAKAINLTAERQISHVVYLLNNDYNVAIEGQYTGKILETIVYEDNSKSAKKGKVFNKQEKVQDLPELSGTTDSEVLPGN